MKIIPISKARENIYHIIDQAVNFSEPVEITSRKGNVVLVSKDDWESLQETIYLMSIPGFMDSIREADKTPIEEWATLEELGWDIQ